jgi:hypothetical protein
MWKDAKISKPHARMLWLRALIHAAVDAICDILGIN